MNRLIRGVRALLLFAALAAAGAPTLPARAQDTSAPAGELSPDTLSLMRRLPENTLLVLTTDLGEDNPSVRFARRESENPDDQKAWAAMEQDMREGFSRMLRLFGQNVELYERLSAAMGPRSLLAVLPGPKPDAPPHVLLLASVEDREAFEAQLHRLISSVARNATETVTPQGDARLHTWSGFFGSKFTLHYMLGDRIAAASSSADLLTPALAEAGGTPPAWLNTLTAATPRGLMNAFISPSILDLLPTSRPQAEAQSVPPVNKKAEAEEQDENEAEEPDEARRRGAGRNVPDLKALGFAGQAMTLGLTEDGLMLTQTALIGDEGLLSIVLGGAAKIPALSDSAFNRVPEGTLAALAASDPSQWLKVAGGFGLLGPLMSEEDGEMPIFMNRLITLFTGDVTLGLRTLLPIPSVLATVKAESNEAAEKKLEILNRIAEQRKVKLRVETLSDGRKVTALPIGREPFSTVYAQALGETVVASSDRRTLEEAAGLTGGANSLAESASFQEVRRHLGDSPRLLFYADLQALSGAGMILSHVYFPATPMGRYLAGGFREVRGMGVGIEFGADRLVSRTFISGDPGKIMPALAAGSLAAIPLSLGIGMPMVTQARENRQRVECMNHMKQLSIAALVYAEDHDDHYPRANQWEGQLKPYVKNTSVYHCPADPRPGSSYAMNMKLSRVSIGEVGSPEETVLFYETDSEKSSPHGIGEDLAIRHAGRHNVAFADGRVEPVSEPLEIEAFRLEKNTTPATPDMETKVSQKPAARTRSGKR